MNDERASARHAGVRVEWQWTPDRHCTLCGRLLIRTYLSDRGHPFCDAECAELYRTYWLPRHGGAVPPG